MALNSLNTTFNIDTENNLHNVKSANLPSFWSNNALSKDTVEISAKKQPLDKKTKIAAAIGSVIGFVAITAFTVKKFSVSEVKKLAEHIDFQEAKTLEQAIEWGKKNLGIRSYEGFDANSLDKLNWINEGITNVSNKLKGELRIPKKITYKDLEKDNVPADASLFGLRFNKKIYDNIDNLLKDNINNLSESGVLKISDNDQFSYLGKYFYEDDLRKVAKQIIEYNKGNIKDFKSKMKVYINVKTVQKETNMMLRYPINNIKAILEKPELAEQIRNGGVHTDPNVINKMNQDEQLEYLKSILDILKNTPAIRHKNDSPFRTIYHEMGHLQDDELRVLAKGKFKNESDYPEALKDWLKNKEDIETCALVSEYSTTGPGEFIAETFADFVSGNKIHEKVKALYKKLKGPLADMI